MNLIPKACFFTGHRIIANRDQSRVRTYLREEILNKINQGITVFITGGALGFDTIAAEEVLNLRNDYPNITLTLYLPCFNQDAEWIDKDKEVYNDIKNKADEIFYVVKDNYVDGCMKKRNQAMVDASDCGIAYLVNNYRSGSSQTVKIAIDKGIDIINIAEYKKNE